MEYLFNRPCLKIQKLKSKSRINKTNSVEETIVDFTLIYSNLLNFKLLKSISIKVLTYKFIFELIILHLYHA